jgi:GH25 family lysozyme M1 (1,4-beta-N-acetylmuramidase)
MAVVFGIDVSHFQRGLSLAAVRRQGYEFVIAKATQGQGVQDAEFHTFREEAESLGMLFAAYHFLHSDSSARAQADNLAEQLNGETRIPVMIDCEPTKGSSPTMADVRRFIVACENRDLRVTILYLPRFHWQALGQPKLGPRLPPVMQALYGRNRGGAGSDLYPGNDSERWGGMGGRTPELLQFGSRGRITGFKRLKIDVDAFRGTRQELAASGMFLTPHRKKAAGAKKVAPAKRPASVKKINQTDDSPVMWRGRRLNVKTILMLQSAERLLGQRLVITQGSFSSTVTTSKGTHDRGGVIDISVRGPGPSTARKVRVLRKEGFAAWHRLPSQFKPEEKVSEHIHAVSLFDKFLSPEAKNQKRDYRADPPLNGLKNKHPDDGPRVHVPDHPTLVKQTVRRRDIVFMQTNDSVGYLQDVLGLTPDKFFGPKETQRFTKEQFGWNGRKPMSERLFRRLFPAELFVLDAAAAPPPDGIAMPRQRTTTSRRPAPV